MRIAAVVALAPLLFCLHCEGDDPEAKASPDVAATRPDASQPEPAEPDAEAPSVDAGTPDARGDAGVFSPDALEQLELGSVDGDGEITFELPDRVAGFQIVASRQANQQVPFVVESLEAPGGEKVVDAGLFVGAERSVYETFSLTTLAMTVPQHDTAAGLAPAAGTWKLRVGGAGGTIDVRILLRRTSDGAPKPGMLDLKIYVPQGLELDEEKVTVTNAETIAPVQNRLAAFDAELQKLYGVGVGRVQFAPLAAKFRALEETFFDVGASTTGDGKVLHLVLSEETEYFWGIAGGIPGAVGTSGTDTSAFALASLWRYFSERGIDYETLAAVEGSVLAHEAGHFLGLFHSTESDGSGDPLGDTPPCSAATIESSIESCPDYANVMFFSSQEPNQIASPLQKRIVQGSALLRGFTLGQSSLLARRPQPKLAKPGFLFHAPGRDLTAAERLALAGSCGTASHRVPTPSAAMVPELERIAADATLPPVFRAGATRALGR